MSTQIGSNISFGNALVKDEESHVAHMDWCFAHAPVPVAEGVSDDELREVCSLTPLSSALPSKADAVPGPGGSKAGPALDSDGNVPMSIGAGLPTELAGVALDGTEIFLGARFVNEVGLYSNFTWSPPMLLGTHAKTDPAASYITAAATASADGRQLEEPSAAQENILLYTGMEASDYVLLLEEENEDVGSNTILMTGM